MIYIFLVGAIVTEMTGTLSLRMASQPGASKNWLISVVAGYVLAFALLALSLDGGLPVGVAYGIWAAAGVALTAIASRILFREPLTKVMILGIALIIGGVLFIELGAQH